MQKIKNKKKRIENYVISLKRILSFISYGKFMNFIEI